MLSPVIPGEMSNQVDVLINTRNNRTSSGIEEISLDVFTLMTQSFVLTPSEKNQSQLEKLNYWQ